jgi:hypothetical protein
MLRTRGKSNRSKERQKWHKELKKIWQSGPQVCEFRYEGCTVGFMLTPAHSRKRRHIQTKEDYFEIAIACLNCHRILDEKMNHETMRAEVLRAIANRKTSPQQT